MFDQYLQQIRSEPEEGWEEQYDRWYNEEHLPSLLTVPEFTWARRYVSLDGPSPKYTALYGLTDPNVFQKEHYLKARDTAGTVVIRQHYKAHTRNVYKLIYPEIAVDKLQGKGSPHKYLLLVRMDVEEGWEEEFRRWYNEEHVKNLLTVPGFLSGARYESIEGTPRFMAIYEIETPEIFKTETYLKARETEWTLRMRSHFGDNTRNVYQLFHEGKKP